MLRTFSKLHGLAGLRLGWGYSNSKIINYLMAVRGPFSVNSIAIQAGIIAMKDIDFQNSPHYCIELEIDLEQIYQNAEWPHRLDSPQLEQHLFLL